MAEQEQSRRRLNCHEQMLDAQSQCVPCKLCGGNAIISDAGEGAGYYIACSNSQSFREAKGCLITLRRQGGWAYNVMDWWNRLHATPDAVNADKALNSWSGDPHGLANELRRVANCFGEGFRIVQLLRDAADEIDTLTTPAPDKALMPEAECLGYAKAISYERFGIPWSLLEKPSKDELLAEAHGALVLPTPVEEPEKGATCSDCLPHDDPGENTRCADCPHLIAEAREAYAEPTTIVKAGKCGRHYDKDCDACQKALAWNDGELDRLRAALAAATAGQVEAELAEAIEEVLSSLGEKPSMDGWHIEPVHSDEVTRLRSALAAFKKSEVGHE